MKNKAILLALALGASTCLLSAQDNNNPDNQGPPPPRQGPPAQFGGPGGQQGGPGRMGHPGFHVLPPRAAERLNLTADQQQQLADLEKEVKARLEKILTPEQLQQLKQMRPPGRPGGPGGFGGPGGPGRPGQGRGPGGPGGQGGPGPDGPPPGQ